jgi:hypothetical protein
MLNRIREESDPFKNSKLIEQVRKTMRTLHIAKRTEEAYVLFGRATLLRSQRLDGSAGANA